MKNYIKLEEQKKLLIDILKYIDNICRKNDIKYTLYYGSLIGAIRHNGVIPWDDDIDIALLKDDYENLIKCLKKDNNERFKLINSEIETTYYYPFAKVVDTKTILQEKNRLTINNYGIYVDIFKLNNIPNDFYSQEKYFKKLLFLKRKIAYSIYNNKENVFKNIYFKIKALSSNYKINNKKYIKHTEQFNQNNTKFIISNWPGYGIEKEKQLKSHFNEFIDVPFEDITVMIIKNYDEVLTKMYGDYMTPPPVDKRITHHYTEVYWRDNNEK